jgi:hypothetical protein
VGFAEKVGFETIIERGRLAAEELPEEIIYLGISLGVLPAQMLAQTRPGVRGAVFISACLPRRGHPGRRRGHHPVAGRGRL